MTVVEEFQCRDTESLVLSTKSFYPAEIPIAHYQLRHFISSPEPDLIYYASEYEVYCLNTATKQRTHITTLPFDARCFAAGFGWVCAGGGEHGHFAMIKLDGDPEDSAEVDALLPVDFTTGSASRLSKPSIKVERLGEQIVNSVSIHRLEDDDGQEDVVAVLTDNDKTVRIYSLTRGEENAVLGLPFPMNHATISPDGKLLVAVGDFQQAYFYERAKHDAPAVKASSASASSPAYEWEVFQIVQLHVPKPSMVTGYFTTAWSPSGTLVAVASECGYITVFDVDLLRGSGAGEDAIVEIVSSTRPATTNGPGAIRSMLFSPQPWDLLVWAEGHDRVCVADIRAGLRSRQIVELDPDESGILQINVEDIGKPQASDVPDASPAAEFIRRYQRAYSTQGTSAPGSSDYLEVQAERRRIQRLAGLAGEVDNGLTEHEQQVLEALRTTRQREELRQRVEGRASGVSSRGAQYSPSELGGSRTTSTPLDLPSVLEPGSSSTPQVPAVSTISDYIRERERNRTAGRERMISEAITPSARSPRSPGDDPWATIEAAMAQSRREAAARIRAAGERAAASQTPATAADLPGPNTERRRQLSARARDRLMRARVAHDPSTMGAYDATTSRRLYTRHHGDPSWGIGTTGLAMSQDGGKLFVGTEKGIFELMIDLRSRKAFPALVPR